MAPALFMNSDMLVTSFAERGKLMKHFMGKVVLALVGGATTASAAVVTDTSGPGFMTMAFLGFLAVILAVQCVPGLILFFGMLRGIFSATEKKKISPALGGNGDRIG